MPRIAVLLAAACLVLAGCGGNDPAPGPQTSPPGPQTSPPAPGDHSLTLAFGGTTYKYLLHAPPAFGPDRRLPLVIALHFYPGTGAQIRETSGFDPVADREGFLVAYPDGPNGGGFNALICCGSTDDVGFLRALAAHLVDRWHADPNRVFVTGISNGGDMSFRAAVEASDTFAAVGVVSGGFLGPLTAPADYAPKKPVSVITFIGTSDRYYDSFSTGIDTWRQRLNCPPAAPAALPDGTAGTYTKARCADGSDVDAYVIDRMGHVWPGARTGQLAGRDITLSATELIWAFFAAHPR